MNTNQKKAGVAVLISHRAASQQGKWSGTVRGTTHDKGSVLQEDLMILNVCAPYNRASDNIRQKAIKLQGEIDS